MPDQLETQSLADPANLRMSARNRAADDVSREPEKPAPLRERFDGFLKTFIERDNRPVKTAADSQKDPSSGPAGENSAGRAVSRLTSREKQTMRQALAKTASLDRKKAAVSGEPLPDAGAPSILSGLRPADAETVRLDPQLAETAEEAARIIWRLLYPGGGAAAAAGMEMEAGLLEPGIDETFALAGALRKIGLADAAGGAAGAAALAAAPRLAADAFNAALETANASAEMNIDAVLSVLDELLEGMPREVLNQAMNRTAEALGLAGSTLGENPLKAIGEALGVEIIAVNGGNAGWDGGGQFLAELEAQTVGREFFGSVAPERRNGLTEAAENAEMEIVSERLFSPEKIILTEKDENAARGRMKISVDPDTELENGLLNQESQSGEIGAAVRERMKISADPDTELENGLLNQESQSGEIGAAAPADHAAPLAVCARAAAEVPAVSTLLDRIENIERLTEAVKLANRGGTKNITLALSPPELGKVTLKVESRGGVVSAFLQVEKPEAVSHLTAGLRELRENLKAQGIELGELDIRQQQRQNQAMGEGEGGQRRPGDREASSGAEGDRIGRLAAPAEMEEADLAAGAAPGWPGPGNLNLFA
ncbi:MAG: flagellar hook-length control protein FliK [Planctomycetota bacterium]|nr:flagellar hook-length control protein FliK [Planctomycetota bacterium]